MRLEDVLAKCDYFTRVHLWPLKKILNPEGWLQNFRADEMEHAVHLLNGFMYFHENLVQEMLASAVQSLSRRVTRIGDSFVTAAQAWSLFLDDVLVVPVSGEHDNPSDSGYSFARIARQHLGFAESQIVSPSDALVAIATAPRPILFVDDLVGTGNQFVGTWYREFAIPGGATHSFSSLAATRGTQFFYCPVLCTETGFNEIRLQCPSVHVNPAHLLSHRYSALASDSLLWPDHLLSGAVDFIRTVSNRVGIPDTDGGSPDDWQGYEKLGLVIAIRDTVPDATIPLIRWNSNGWQPLMVKA
ncbi:hypothetical protein [Granulicella sp. S156]|uniref:phosphoribosyltransferase-like protein n=1 Tax=Granulicella sp. S156 TaxID=1747224 RepID=UPI00131BA6C2|nr:hypothetical protein [Granulicella sp. S156]